MRPLRIGIDGWELTGRITGVGRYISEVVSAWVRRQIPHAIVIFVPDAPSADLVRSLGAAVEWHVVGSGTRALIWQQWHLPRAAARAHVDVFFAGAYTAPVRLHCPYVLVVHDVSYFAHPEWFSPRERLRRQWLTRVSVRRAAHVLAVSQFSADEINRFLGPVRAPVTVARGGAPHVAAVPVPATRTTEGPMVLYVGSLFNRRLIPELIAGFARLVAAVPNARLVLVGDNRTYPRIEPHRLAAEHRVAGRVEWRDYVDDDELDRLYAQAGVFAFLSTYEGFGLTPLEAIARGVPPVLLDTPVGREIYGEAALFVDRDPASIARALQTSLVDTNARQKLVERGRQLLDRYDWAATADIILTALEDAASRR
jgi:glycosyltransferase involved in cell wall biosynthesis